MMNDEPDQTGLVIVVDDVRPMVEPNTAMVAPELIARVRAMLRALKIRQTNQARLDSA